jgi:hypothetical protein
MKKFFKVIGIIFLFILCLNGCVHIFHNEEPTSRFDDEKTINKVNTETKTQEVIEYDITTVDSMIDILKSNALKAKKTFQNKNIEVTGQLANIDSDGDYFTLFPLVDEFNLVGIHCSVTNEEQLDKLMRFDKNQCITIRGQITDVGEVLGYYLDVHDIITEPDQ